MDDRVCEAAIGLRQTVNEYCRDRGAPGEVAGLVTHSGSCAQFPVAVAGQSYRVMVTRDTPGIVTGLGEADRNLLLLALGRLRDHVLFVQSNDAEYAQAATRATVRQIEDLALRIHSAV